MFPLALLAGLALAAPTPGPDWPQWMGPDRAGVFTQADLPDTFPKDGPPVEWRVPVGDGYAGPAVAGGKVFLLDRIKPGDAPTPTGAFDTKTVVKGQERVRCLDAATGKDVWTHGYDCPYRLSYSAGPRCTPTVDGARVYALGAMGDLHCVNIADGKVLWAKNFPRDYGSPVPVWGFAAHPLVDGDNLICLVGGTDGRLVVAFDKVTGAEKWHALSFDSGDFGYNPPVIATLAGKRTLLVWHPKAVVGLDPATGAKRWDVPMTARSALTAPMLRTQGDRVFLTAFYEGSTLLEVTPAGAKILWKSKARGERPAQTLDLSSIITTPVWAGEHIYGVDSYGELRCLEAATGKRVWTDQRATRGRLTPPGVRERDTPSETAPWSERWACAFLTPTGGDKYLIFNEQGELIRAKLTPAGYEELGRVVLLEPTNKLAGRPVVWTHPAYAGGSVFARNDKELVRARLGK